MRGSWSCSDANRIASIVASIRGRAKLGLQVSSLVSIGIRSENLERVGSLLVVGLVGDELVKLEVVKDEVVVRSHMIVVKIEGVGKSGEVVFKEVRICVSGCRSVEIAAEVVLMRRLSVKSRERVVGVAELVQGRCSSD